MKVKFLTSVAGADFHYLEGEVVELPAQRATEFLAANFCEALAEKKEASAERAVRTPKEKRAK